MTYMENAGVNFINIEDTSIVNNNNTNKSL